MEVDEAAAKHTAKHDGQTYYFCAAGCKKAFVAVSGLQLHGPHVNDRQKGA